MWWFYNCNLYLYQFMCSINYNLRGNIYGSGTANGNINLSCKYYNRSMLNTSADKYCFQCVVSYCIGKWWLQWYFI